MIKHVNAEYGPLDQAYLNKITRWNTIPFGDRDLKQSRLEEIQGYIENGCFYCGDFGVAYCKETKKKYRVNGNHQITVLLSLFGKGKGKGRSNQRLDDERLTRVEHQFECDLLVELITIFDYFDSQTSARNNTDIFKICSGQYAEYKDFNPKQRKALQEVLRGVNRYRIIFNHDPLVLEPVISRDLPTLLADDEVREYCDFILNRLQATAWVAWKYQHIGAAIYGHWKSNPEAAHLFWEEVCCESNTDASSRSRVYAKDTQKWFASGKRRNRMKYFSEANQAFKRWCKEEALTVGV